ncbi:hypothetical protein ACE6H2_016499 [Prunus campanulata]
MEWNWMELIWSMGASLLKQEMKKMQSNPSDDLKFLVLTGNKYDWQFAIRGPNGTEFEGGIYHGRIQFPEKYPYSNPILTLLTPNGRFETQTDISSCDIWGWGPFSVQITLHALIESLPTDPDGAWGSVEYDKEERRALAIKSREAAPRYGTAERQKLIDEIHEYMLSKVPPVPSNRGGDIWVSYKNDSDGGGDIRVSYKNDSDKRMPSTNINIFVSNTVNANDCEQAGFIDFGNKCFKVPHVPSNRGGDIWVSYKNDSDGGGDIRVSNKNDSDKRMPRTNINIFISNIVNANDCDQAGFMDFGNKCFKIAKQDVSSRETGSTSREDYQE